jgi:hypothetical protein
MTNFLPRKGGFYQHINEQFQRVSTSSRNFRSSLLLGSNVKPGSPNIAQTRLQDHDLNFVKIIKKPWSFGLVKQHRFSLNAVTGDGLSDAFFEDLRQGHASLVMPIMRQSIKH